MENSSISKVKLGLKLANKLKLERYFNVQMGVSLSAREKSGIIYARNEWIEGQKNLSLLRKELLSCISKVSSSTCCFYNSTRIYIRVLI